MPQLTRQRSVDAPPAVVWDVITDHELYAEAAPNLETVEVLEGEGVGLVRRCVDTDGNEWTESCTRWTEGTSVAVAVDVASSDFHRRLFTRFEGEWVLDDGGDGVTITVRFTYEPRYWLLGKLISWYFSARGPPIVEALLDNWEGAIDDRSKGPDRPRDTATTHVEGGTDALR